MGAPAGAARPLLDSHQWDSYFALYARDANVPWKHPAVRLDTFSGAQVDFAAYAADPADVLVAGAYAKPRPLDVSHKVPVVRWKFTPPPGYQFEANDVELPLNDREGFYVIEARRGDASQQVWVNLSRIALFTKESPGGTFVYATDLRSGKALRAMSISYLVGTTLVPAKTDEQGISRLPTGARARFALAQLGKSWAFVSFLPQSPVPASLVGVRVERGVVRAGDHLRVIGFARKRVGPTFRPGTGEAKVSLLVRGRAIATALAKLDTAGAFTAEVTVPPEAQTGEAVVLATSGAATGGATVRIEGGGDLALAIQSSCTTACPADVAFPIVVSARRAGAGVGEANVHVKIVRTPHILPPGEPEETIHWGTTTVFDQTVRTEASGLARVTIPMNTDGLASTYGISASTSSTIAQTQLAAPTAKFALAVAPLKETIDLGEVAAIDVRAFEALDGNPMPNITVDVKLTHGVTVQEEHVKLDAQGRGRATFHDVALGTNFATADADVDGKHAFDAASVTVSPSALGARVANRNADIAIVPDKVRYRPGDKVIVSAVLAGASGDAILTMEGARPYEVHTVSVRDGRAIGTFTVPESFGDCYLGAAFVKDGALSYGTLKMAIDGPGHPRLTTLSADKPAYTAGENAKITLHDGESKGTSTIAVRVADGRSARSASFDDAPGLLAVAGTTSQNIASDDPAWHAYVAPAKSTAGDIFAFDRPRAAANIESALAVAAPRNYVWKIERSALETIDVALPKEKGRFVLSILKLTDDGDVGAATIPIVVQ